MSRLASLLYDLAVTTGWRWLRRAEAWAWNMVDRP